MNETNDAQVTDVTVLTESVPCDLVEPWEVLGSVLAVASCKY